MCLNKAVRLLLCVSLSVFVAGCSSKQAVESDSGAANSEQPAVAATAEQAEAAPVEATEESPGSVADGSFVAAGSVTLGSSELTRGIPGEGPLTVEQIQAWLDEPANHAPLNVALPKGLALGASGIRIPEVNPMTRAKIELGRQLYFDRRLSADGAVSCADCHAPDEGFARHTQFGVGINGQTGNRNSPVSYNRILSEAQFWDGRASSLEAQAVGPMANPIEMGNTHEAAVEAIANIPGYRMQFEKVFDDGVRIDNLAKAIASFERAIVTGPSPFDFYEPLRVMRDALKDDLEDLDALKADDPDLYEQYTTLVGESEAHPISESAQRGRELFFSKRGGCTACHVGANFTDEKYHNLGVGMDKDEPDLGRNAVTSDDKDRGAFKTPTIRNVATSAPYMHDGSQTTLEEVVEWYAKGGHPNPHLSKDVKKLDLNDQEKKDIVEFMKACTGEFPTVEKGRLPQ